DGRLANEADRSLLLHVPSPGLSPGTSTYLATTAALMDLAVRFGAARGLGGWRDARRSLGRASELARRTLADSLEPARRAAERIAGRPWVTYLGAGPNEVSARFGAA